MNIRRAKHGLWLLTAVLTVGGLLIVVVGLRRPYEHPMASAPATPTGQRPQTVKDSSTPKLSDFSKVWSLDLRRPLYDPPPQPVSEKVVTLAPPAKLDVQLLGYAVEDNHSLAFLLGPDRKVELLAVGDQIGGATVRSITPDGVTLDHRGQEHLLVIEDDSVAPVSPSSTTRRLDRSSMQNRRYQ